MKSIHYKIDNINKKSGRFLEKINILSHSIKQILFLIIIVFTITSCKLLRPFTDKGTEAKVKHNIGHTAKDDQSKLKSKINNDSTSALQSNLNSFDTSWINHPSTWDFKSYAPHSYEKEDEPAPGPPDLDEDAIVPFAGELTREELDRLHNHIKNFEQGETRVEVISPEWVSITFVPFWHEDNNNPWNANSDSFQSHIIQPDDAELESHYNIYSLTDINYSEPRSSKSIGFQRKEIYSSYKRLKSDLRIAQTIFIQMPAILKENHKYNININSSVTGNTENINFSYDQKRFNSAIHVSNTGYGQNDSKKAYIGLFMGSYGEFKLQEIKFEIIDLKTRKIVYTGEATQQIPIGWTSPEKSNYQYVFELNFSKLNTPGNYIIEHSDLGRSIPFKIEGNALRSVMKSLALGVYHQRSNYKFEEPYTRFTQEEGHMNDGIVYNQQNQKEKDLIKIWFPQGFFYNTNLEGSYIDARGGHYDAGDYGKYSYNGALAIWNLITLIDAFPKRSSHDNLGIPESNNGRPDLIDELLIEIQWLQNMQDPEDGGVFSVIKPISYYQLDMPDASIERIIFPKNTIETAAFAAAFARLARSPILKKYSPNLIPKFKDQALLAWDFLEKNSQQRYPVGDYGEFDDYSKKGNTYGIYYGSLDDRAWAAIELYAITENTKFYEYAKKFHHPNAAGSYENINRTISLWDNSLPILENEFKKSGESAFKSSVEQLNTYSKETPYGLLIPTNVKPNNCCLGWYFPLADKSFDLMLAYKIYDNIEYKNVVLDQLYYTTGANPTNTSFITGLGHRQITEMVGQKGSFDNITPPVVGLPKGLIATNKNKYYGKAFENYPNIPIMSAYADNWNIRREYIFPLQIQMLGVVSILNSPTKAKEKQSQIEVNMIQETGGTYKFSINYKIKNSSNYDVYWKFINENDTVAKFGQEVIFTQNPTDLFDQVEVNVIDKSGTYSFASKILNNL